MTFYEAALRVLESEGHPLHVQEITQKSIAQSLLSHVGKTPEQTMLSRLAAMARRKTDRRLIVTAKDTFALTEWSLQEDADALAQTGVPEPNPEEELPPLRPPERHPEARTDNLRSAGRQERKRRREDEERGRKRRFPPLPEVVFEILSEPPGSLTAAELVEEARTRELAGEDLSAEQILTALLEDNQRRIDAGRRPQFLFAKETGKVSLERAGAPLEAPPLELQAAFAEALGIPLEGGRPVLRSVPSTAAADAAHEAASLLPVARSAVKDARKAMARALRRRLAELDAGSFEKAVIKVLHHAGFRELKVAKRSKDGPLLTSRRREGSVELRFAIRVAKGQVPVERRSVQELRRDLGHYSAQVGLLLSSADVRGDARGEAQASGALVMLWCGEALAEKFLEHGAGVQVTPVELFELDERFFESVRQEAHEAQRRRDERHREREAHGAGERTEVEAGQGPPEAVATAEPAHEPEEGPEGEDTEGVHEAEGPDEGLEAASAYVSEGAAPGGAGEPERRRRRRRRRGRRGRGPRPEGAPGGAQEASGGSGASGPSQPPAAPPGPAGGGPEPA